VAWGEAIAVWVGTGTDTLSECDDRTYGPKVSRYVPGSGWEVPETIGVGVNQPPSNTDVSGSKSLGIMDSNGIDLAINANGESMVVWHVWANRFEPGVGWNTPTPLSTDEAVDAYWPRIVMDEHGRGIAVWHQAKGYSQDPVRMWWSRYE
jgi:hypothetical protein